MKQSKSHLLERKILLLYWFMMQDTRTSHTTPGSIQIYCMFIHEEIRDNHIHILEVTTIYLPDVINNYMHILGAIYNIHNSNIINNHIHIPDIINTHIHILDVINNHTHISDDINNHIHISNDINNHIHIHGVTNQHSCILQ